MTPDPSGGARQLYDALNRQFRRMLACRSNDALDPTFVEEEATLCEMLQPVLTRMARGREEWVNGALAELCQRWRRGCMTCITPRYLHICVQEAGRQECKGWLPVLPDEEPTLKDASPGPITELIQRDEADEARRIRRRLGEEVRRFIESLEDHQLRDLARVMLRAEDLAWGFYSRYAIETKRSPSNVTRMKQELHKRFLEHLRSVKDLPALNLALADLILALREVGEDRP
jgi:hypothetical protein